jgi:HNH endonuclease
MKFDMIKLTTEIRGTTNEIRFRKLIGTPDKNGCWPWTGTKDRTGYGRFGVKFSVGVWKTTVLAHRVSFVLFKGEIPDGDSLDHLCRNRACVNPAHLEAVSFKENVLRGESFTARNARKEFCPKGHPLLGENLKLDRYKTGRVARRCRQCANAAVLRHYAKFGKPSERKK